MNATRPADALTARTPEADARAIEAALRPAAKIVADGIALAAGATLAVVAADRIVSRLNLTGPNP